MYDKATYFNGIGYKPHEKQWLYHNSDARFRLPNCGRRFGKMLSVSTALLTPDGWTTMSAVQVGDEVYGPNGQPNRVVAKSDVALNEVCYEVVFDDGTVIVAHDQHQWAVETYTMRKSRGNGRWDVKPYKIVTTAELSKRVGKVKYPDSIMLTQPVQMPEQKQPLDPYLYGLWLGDGNTSDGMIYGLAEDVAKYSKSLDIAFDYTGSKVAYRVPKLRAQLQLLGVLGNKSVIPDSYRFGSVSQRLALLQGLMDTDGTLSNEQIQFDNTNRDLVDLVAWLVNSLGGKGRFSQHEPYYTKDGERIYCKTAYRFGFNIALPVFRLQRKLDKQMRLKQGPQTVRRYIRNIERIESVPMQCIQVEGQDGLYLAGVELVVTHNSTMAGRDLEPRLFEPNKMFWIVGPTYDLGEKEFRVIWHDLIVKKQLGKDRRVKKAYNKKQGNMFIEFPWQSRLEVRSADHPENLVGEALDWVIMSEAAKHKEETWERYIRPALADRRGGADFPTTPEGFNWLWQLWMLGKDPDFPEYESWRFPSWDNLAIYPEGYEDPEIRLMIRTMLPERFQQEIGAEFGSFAGKIFPEWDAGLHVQSVGFNPNWPNYMAFDWGYTNPLAAIEFQISPDDRIHVWREHYRAFTTLPDHIAILKQRDQPLGYHLDMAFGDAADPEAAITVSTKLVQCMALPEAKENWREGIDLVRGFMKVRESYEEVDEFGTPAEDGGPGLVVDFSCVNLIRELNNYKSPESVKGRNVPEMGNKVEDHAIDALRYGIVHKYKFGAGTSLESVYGSAGIDAGESSNGGYFTTAASGSSADEGYFTAAGVF